MSKVPFIEFRGKDLTPEERAYILECEFRAQAYLPLQRLYRWPAISWYSVALGWAMRVEGLSLDDARNFAIIASNKILSGIELGQRCGL